MSLYPFIFLILLIVSAIAASIVAYFLFEKRRGAPGAHDFGMLLITVIVWIVGNIIEYYSTGINEKIIGLDIQYIFGIPYATVFWFCAAVNYITLGKKPKKIERAILFVIPVITTVLLLTSNYHRLYYFNFRIYNYGSFSLLFKDWGVWYYMHVFYSYLLLLSGSVLLLYSLKKRKLLYRNQVFIFFISILCPWTASILYVTGMKSFMMVDFTPIAMIIAVALMSWSILKFGMFDIVPAAHDFIIESMDNGLIVLDNSNRIVDVNPEARKFFNNEDYIGRPIKDFFSILNINQDLLESDPKNFSSVGIDDEIFNVSTSVIFNKRNSPSGRLINFYNITELKKKENELSESNAAKDKFFSIIAHDLKNPFFSIVGLADILTDPNDKLSEEERNEMILSIKNISVSTYSILENLLEWAYQQTGKLKFKPEYFDLDLLVKENIMQVHNTAEVKGIKINSSIDENFIVFADMNMIQTVLRNLISNAIKFTMHGGLITISAKKTEANVYTSISDTGIGIEKNTIDQIFKIGKTNMSVGTAGERGTGLGLVLCKEFVEKNGGRIFVESEPGKGSTFSFSIPAKDNLR